MEKEVDHKLDFSDVLIDKLFFYHHKSFLQTEKRTDIRASW